MSLFALWINLHGSWLIGYTFLMLYLASGPGRGGSWGSIESTRWNPQRWRKLFVVSTASLAALFLNPYGWRLVVYPFDLMFRQQLNVAVIDEWRSVDFQSFYGALMFLIVAGIILFTLGQRRSWSLSDVVFALFAFYAALTHKRFLFLAGIVVCPILAIECGSQVFSPYESAKGQALAKHHLHGCVLPLWDQPHSVFSHSRYSRSAVFSCRRSSRPES